MLTKTLLALSLLTGIVATNPIQFVNAEINKIDSTSTIAQLPVADIENIARSITVQIKVGQDKGSGILIARDNNTYTVITNAGVTNRGDSYTIVTSEGIEHQARLVNSTSKSDLAVLEFSSDNTYSIATIGNSNTITEGEAVIAAGFGESENDISITKGTITHITEKPLNKGYSIGFNNETVQGMSGGVLLNSNGEVIAVLGKGNAILDTAYSYSDGTLPTAEQIAQYRQYSFSIPIANIALISPQLAALVPNNSNTPQIAQAETPKTEYTGIVKTVDDIAQQITVRIATAEKPSYGSGAIIARDGNTYYVATVAHNFPQDTTNSYQIVTNDGESHQLDLNTVKKSDAYDFAIFSFTSDKEYTVATIGNYTVAANDEQVVFTSGFPGMYAPSRIITGGKVREQETTSFATKDSSTFISTTTDRPGLLYSNISYKGMSGGAVLDSEGRLVGINTGAENELYFDEEGNDSEIALGFSLGIPLTDVLTFIDRKTPLKTEWLQTTSNTAAEVSDNDLRSIEEQLLTTETPQDKNNVAKWMNYGNQLWRYEKYNEAVSAFKQVIAINPNYDRAYYAMGLTLFYQGDYSQAVTTLEKATQINSNSYFYWRYLGNSYRELEQYAEAISAYEEAIAKSPEDFVLYVEHGDVLRESKKYRKAIAFYNEAMNINPQHSWIYNNRGNTYNNLEQYQQALNDFNRAIEINPYFAQAYNNRANTYNNLEQYQQALDDYNKAIEINPYFAQAYNNRGAAYYNLEQYQQAIDDFTKAIEINPKYSNAYNNRGNTYNDLEQYLQAIDDFTKAIEIDPYFAQTYNNRGNNYNNLGQYQQALDDFNRAIEIDPYFAEAYNNRGATYNNLGQYQQALNDFNRAIEINPNNAKAYNNRGNNYNNLGQYQQALDDFNRAIEINPYFAEPYDNRGNTYNNLGQYQQALDDYNKAIKINPNYAKAYYNRGNTYYDLEQYQQALNDYHRAIKINPNYSHAYGNLGLVYKQLNNIEEARINLEKARDLFVAQNNSASAKWAASLLEQLPQ